MYYTLFFKLCLEEQKQLILQKQQQLQHLQNQLDKQQKTQVGQPGAQGGQGGAQQKRPSAVASPQQPQTTGVPPDVVEPKTPTTDVKSPTKKRTRKIINLLL